MKGTHVQDVEDCTHIEIRTLDTSLSDFPDSEMANSASRGRQKLIAGGNRGGRCRYSGDDGGHCGGRECRADVT